MKTANFITFDINSKSLTFQIMKTDLGYKNLVKKSENKITIESTISLFQKQNKWIYDWIFIKWKQSITYHSFQKHEGKSGACI